MPRSSNSLQSVPGLLLGTQQGDLRHVADRQANRRLTQIGENICQHGPCAAGVPVHFHADRQIFPGRLDAGSDPALQHVGRQVDPSGTAPGAQQYGRPGFSAGPDRKGRPINRLAAPDLPHHLQIGRQRLEPRVEVGLHRGKIVARRSAAHAEAEASLTEQVQSLDTMRVFDRMPQRDLDDGVPNSMRDVWLAIAPKRISGSSVGLPRANASVSQIP